MNDTPARGADLPASDDLARLGDELDRVLEASDRSLAESYPGDRGVRQPVHTVYVSGDRFDAGTSPSWGSKAAAVLDEHVSSPDELADATGVARDLAADVLDRVRTKLVREPIEDLRIDFEDGYGTRPDDHEDADVVAAARALATSVREGTAPPCQGIRFKSFEKSTDQ